MLASLAGAMLLAGVLPWATGAESAIRFLSLPLFLAGLMVLGVTLRVWAAGRRPPDPPVQRGCAGCVCGLNGTCATDQSSADTPATVTGADGARPAAG